MSEYTIDLCEGGTPSASSSVEGGAIAAFDNIPTNPWLTTEDAGASWIQYDFGAGNEKRIIKLTILGNQSGYNTYVPTTFNLVGSSNGIDWTPVHSETDLPNWTAYEKREFIFTNEAYYQIYRIEIIDNENPANCIISEIEMMELLAVEENPYIRPDNITGLYNLSSIKGNLRGKASEGWVRPTLKQFFTSTDFEEIVSVIITTAGYIFGGLSGGALKDTDEYIPDTWTSKADMAIARYYLAVSAILGKCYSYAGTDGTNMQDCNEYDPDTWTAKTDMPAPARSTHEATTILDKGYIFGGTAPPDLQDCDEYDPADIWVNKTDMPLPKRTVFTDSTILDKGYIFGGDSGNIKFQDCDEYNPDTWASKTDMPAPARRHLASSTILDKGYVYAGESDGGSTRDCDEYDPDTWVSKTDIPAPVRRYLSATTVESKGYVFSGDGLQDCDEYDPDTWTSRTDVPSPARVAADACSI